MFALYSLVIALLIVAGQALWKQAVVRLTEHGDKLISLGGLLRLGRSPMLLLGVAIYAVATLGYIYLIGRYKYIQIQPLVVGGSLIFTLLVAAICFREPVGPINIAGIGLIIAGALLVIH